MEITASAPGKLFVVGEYAITAGGPAVVAATSRRLSCRLVAERGPEEIHVERDGAIWSGSAGLENPLAIPEKFRFAATAMLVGLRVAGLRELSLRLQASSSLDGGTAKLGVGGSAAITAATLAAMAQLPGGEGLADRDFRSRVALRAHRLAQAGGSGADAVAATVGGLVWIGGVEPTLAPETVGEASGELPHCLSVEGISLPEDMTLDAVATGRPAQSAPRAERFRRVLAGEGPLGAAGADGSRAWVEAMNGASIGLRQACGANSAEAALASLERAAGLLRVLPRLTGIPVWSRELRQIARAGRLLPGAVAKPSGAGGGDCAIALFPTSHRAAWRAKSAEAGFAAVGIDLEAKGASTGVVG